MAPGISICQAEITDDSVNMDQPLGDDATNKRKVMFLDNTSLCRHTGIRTLGLRTQHAFHCYRSGIPGLLVDGDVDTTTHF